MSAAQGVWWRGGAGGGGGAPGGGVAAGRREAGALVDVGGPGVVVAACVGECADRDAQALVAGVTEDGAAAFAAFDGDGALAGVGGERFGVGVAASAVADLGEQGGGGD